MSTGPTCPSKCFADGPGLKGCHVNTRYSFSIFTCDKTGKLRTEGGDALTVDILSSTRVSIRDTHAYIVIYTACQRVFLLGHARMHTLIAIPESIQEHVIIVTVII
jgi:hypothetical protein